MKKFNASFNVGDEVKLKDYAGAGKVEIKAINETRNLIEVVGFVGSFQRSHVIKIMKVKG